MVVESVRVHMLSSQHVVILREAGEERYLPIWIGSWEAQAIAMKLQGVESERPLTHDLLASILGELGVSVRRILVSDLADETYRARIVLVQGGSDFEIDARPSDAIALAVRVGAPIFATEAVLDRAGRHPRGRRGGAAQRVSRVRQLAGVGTRRGERTGRIDLRQRALRAGLIRRSPARRPPGRSRRRLTSVVRCPHPGAGDVHAAGPPRGRPTVAAARTRSP